MEPSIASKYCKWFRNLIREVAQEIRTEENKAS